MEQKMSYVPISKNIYLSIFISFLIIVFNFGISRANTCKGTVPAKPKIIQKCIKTNNTPSQCNQRLKAKATFFPAGLVTLRCNLQRQIQRPAWICRSLQMLSRQLRCQCANPTAPRSGANPYAETALMRHAVKLPLSSEERKALIAASISQDAELILENTAPLQVHAQPEIQYAAILIAAHRLAKLDLKRYRREIRRLVAKLQRLKNKVRTYPASDADFLAALLAMDEGDTENALRYLDAALAQEPAFFNAAVLAVRLQLERLVRDGTPTTRQCLREYNALASRLVRLTALNPCPRMAAHVEVYLSRWFENPQDVAPLAAAQIYLSVMAWDIQRAKKALQRFIQLSPDNGCTRYMTKVFDEFINLSEQQLKN